MLKRSVVLVTFCTVFAFGLVRPAVTQNENNLFVADATASSTQESSRQPTDVLDNNDNTWWNAYGKDQYLELNTGGIATVNAVKIKWYNGAQRTATFHVDVSTDGIKWTRVLTNQNSQRTANLERYPFESQLTRYIRITNRGNSTGNDVIAIIQAVVEGVPSKKTYYVDCVNGNDTNINGTTPDRAWKSLSKVNSQDFSAGDSILLKRGCTFTGPLTLTAKSNGSNNARIVIGAYGREPNPGSNPTLPVINNKIFDENQPKETVKITGQYQIFEYLKVTATKPGGAENPDRCSKKQPVGWRIGFGTESGSTHNIVRYSEASGFTAGIQFGSDSSNNKALHNRLTFNNVMSKNSVPDRDQKGNPIYNDKYDDDSGAWGVLINGNGNEVAYNYFEGNIACSEDYVIEGASVEVYKASDNYIHHNQSIRESTFTELGGTKNTQSERNKYAYNVYNAKDIKPDSLYFDSPYYSISENETRLTARLNRGGEFLVVRGLDNKWGGNPGTEFYHNTGYWLNIGISCGNGCSADILQAHNNIMVASQKPEDSMVWADEQFGESYNIFWRVEGYSGPRLTVIDDSETIGEMSLKKDPRFVDVATN